jgi:hypothetical protein
MRILVFTEGIIVDDRERDGEWRMVGDAARKLQAWARNGATIVYMSSKREKETLEKVRRTLRDGGAPSGELFFRSDTEDYGQTAERARPDIIVEDDCKSIGGVAQMTYPKLKNELRRKVKQVVVPEFEGVDLLPDDPTELASKRPDLPS